MLKQVAFVQCVSTAFEMLRFSTNSFINNAGYDNFLYIVVKWLASNDVNNYLKWLQKIDNRIIVVEYQTNNDVGFVPNLRGMMNCGFFKAFELCDYAGLVNTDQYFGQDWLKYLVKYANENDIVNSQHITPIKGNHVITANLGIPEYGKFNMEQFNYIYSSIFKDELQTEDQRGGWLNTNTMPYIFHKKFWDKAGPWELTGISNSTPDRRFFQRCKDAGAYFTMSMGSIVYHHEAVERRGKRPVGAEYMVEEN